MRSQPIAKRVISVYIRASLNHRIIFMNKRLAKTTPPRSSSGPAAPRRSAGPRPNPFHRFLRRLRAGGRSNMYGAIPYLMHAFELDRDTAFRVVCEWVDLEAAVTQAVPEVSPRR